MEKLFTTKTVVAVTAATAIGLGAEYIHQYVETNSGCFVYERGKPVCKVKELSCCQPKPVPELSYCSLTVDPNICDRFNEDKEGSCCRLCNCSFHECQFNQEMKCRRPTTGEALTYLTRRLTEEFGLNLGDIIWWTVVGVVSIVLFGLFWQLVIKK
ncbi:hypothetical protein AVEN_57377-1 [Araneus ventricosus]|uniref:Uncharacterized protein n=1 Tax=Araneus ventricosus TaxID=182803 RepID=A0A4Y2S9A5_ARAVE|nr:hypothetical protein AVEN_57377-1 [Araneus ventricosus]